MGDADEAPEAVHPHQATNTLPLPTKFDGASKLNQADRNGFERFRIAPWLQNKTEEEQAGILLYAMGRRYGDNTARKRGNRFVHRRQSSTQRLLRGTTQHPS